MSATVYTYRCKNCKTLAITNSAPIAGHPERCACRSWMAFLWSEPMTETQRTLLANRRIVFNPYVQPQDWTCVRCDAVFPPAARGRFRVDGRVCDACYRAEEPPPVRLATREEIDASAAASRRREQEREDAHFAAYYAAQETK